MTNKFIQQYNYAEMSVLNVKSGGGGGGSQWHKWRKWRITHGFFYFLHRNSLHFMPFYAIENLKNLEFRLSGTVLITVCSLEQSHVTV